MRPDESYSLFRLIMDFEARARRVGGLRRPSSDTRPRENEDRDFSWQAEFRAVTIFSVAVDSSLADLKHLPSNSAGDSTTTLR
jgi:hypothetical protein